MRDSRRLCRAGDISAGKASTSGDISRHQNTQGVIVPAQSLYPPGRRSAASMRSGLLVAASTATPVSPSTPSSSVSSWFTTLCSHTAAQHNSRHHTLVHGTGNTEAQHSSAQLLVGPGAAAASLSSSMRLPAGTSTSRDDPATDTLEASLPQPAHLSVTPVESCPLGGAMASNSSKNSTQGAAAAALLNSSRTAASLWPMYLFNSSGPCSIMTIVDRQPQSRAVCVK